MSSSSSSLPVNVHQCTHPCLQAKLSQLRSHSTTTRETKTLVSEIATILGVEAFASGCLKVTKSGRDTTPLGIEYETLDITPSPNKGEVAIVPILRSGLGMVEAINSLLPGPTEVPIYHLGLFRERVTLQPVEYYNNLPFHPRPQPTVGTDSGTGTTTTTTTTTTSSERLGSGNGNAAAAQLAILIDPIIATGATAEAAILLLREWGVDRIVMLSVLASLDGVRRAAQTWQEGVEIWVGSVDQRCDERGMIVPGLGDIGDRLFVARGK